MMITIFFSFLIGVLSQHPCHIVASDGSTYDLTRLASLGTISGTDTLALWTYTISVCGDSVSCGNGVTTGYCQYGTIGGRPYHFNVGYLDQTIALANNEGVELIYSDPKEGRAGRVFISCDPNNLVSKLSVTTPADPWDYEFRFSSIAGCSTVPPCKVTSPNGKIYYDLTDFIGSSPITASDDKGEWKYSVSICQDTIPNCPVCSSAGYCQNSPFSSQTFCVGTYENITGNDDGTGVTLYYDEPTQGRKGQVHITCNPQGGLVSEITAISPSVKTDYAFFFKSKAACPQLPPCRATAPDGSIYDLDALVSLTPLSAVDSENKWNYTVSVCHNTLSCANVDPAGYCQTSVPGPVPSFCIGVFQSIVGLDNGQGVKLVYKEEVLGRIGTVTITCDPTGPLVSDIVAISPDKIEDYQFNFKSSAACKKN